MNGFPAEEFGASPLWSCPPKNDVFHQEAFAKPWLCSKEKLIGMRRLGLGTLVKSMVDDPADCDKFAFKESWHSVFVIKKMAASSTQAHPGHVVRGAPRALRNTHAQTVSTCCFEGPCMEPSEAEKCSYTIVVPLTGRSHVHFR